VAGVVVVTSTAIVCGVVVAQGVGAEMAIVIWRSLTGRQRLAVLANETANGVALALLANETDDGVVLALLANETDDGVAALLANETDDGVVALLANDDGVAMTSAVNMTAGRQWLALITLTCPSDVSVGLHYLRQSNHHNQHYRRMAL
jgi:hypothetical protein